VNRADGKNPNIIGTCSNGFIHRMPQRFLAIPRIAKLFEAFKFRLASQRNRQEKIRQFLHDSIDIALVKLWRAQ